MRALSYQAVGSGGGIKMLLDRQVDFGATDAFLTDRDQNRSQDKILHIPTCLGAVAVIYNIEATGALRLAPEIISSIFRGEITNWSDRRLIAEKAKEKLPIFPLPLFIDPRAAAPPLFLRITFPKPLRAGVPPLEEESGSSGRSALGWKAIRGVAEYVKKIPGSIGYVSLNFAKQHNLPVAYIRNRSGNFISPDLESVTKAASVDYPDDMRLMITDTPAPKGYPISALTYLIVFQEQSYHYRSLEKAEALVRFLQWIVKDGQAANETLFYATLPALAIGKIET